MLADTIMNRVYSYPNNKIKTDQPHRPPDNISYIPCLRVALAEVARYCLGVQRDYGYKYCIKCYTVTFLGSVLPRHKNVIFFLYSYEGLGSSKTLFVWNRVLEVNELE